MVLVAKKREHTIFIGFIQTIRLSTPTQFCYNKDESTRWLFHLKYNDSQGGIKMLRLVGLLLFLLIVLALASNVTDDLYGYSKSKRKNNLSFSDWRKENIYNDIFLPKK